MGELLKLNLDFEEFGVAIFRLINQVFSSLASRKFDGGPHPFV